MEHTEAKITQTDIARAATNSPELAPSFILGGREFKLLDLAYDEYLVFLSKLQPLLAAFVGEVASFKGLSEAVTLGAVTPSNLIAYCAQDLPQLAQIVCRQTDPEITIEEVKRLGKNPFRLATVVLKQIEHNEFITEIADFFAQILPLIKVKQKLSQSTIEETHSS